MFDLAGGASDTLVHPIRLCIRYVYVSGIRLCIRHTPMYPAYAYVSGIRLCIRHTLVHPIRLCIRHASSPQRYKVSRIGYGTLTEPENLSQEFLRLST